MTTQPTETTDFGAGVFDEPEKVTLNAREIAIAKGEDPDDDVEPIEAVVQDWDDADKKLAAKYNLTDEELDEFETPAALHRAVKLIEKASKTAQPSDDTATTPSSDADGVGGVVQSDALKNLGFKKMDIEKLKAAFGEDEDTMEVVNALKSTQDVVEKLAGYIDQQQQREIDAETNRNLKVFHDILDEYPDEFGKTGKLDKGAEAARQKVADAAETIYQGLLARNAKMPSVDEVIKQAITMVNGVAKKSGDRRQNLVTQSSQRRSVGASAAATRRAPAPAADGTAESIASHPELDRFWRMAQEANGVY